MSGRNRSAARGATGAAGADELVTALLTASRALVAVSARSLAELEETVTIPQFRALVVLGRHERINLNGLAEELGVTASTAMRMVDRLLAAGLVTREENPTNRREVVLALSAEGASRVATVTRRRRAGIAAIVRAMPAESRSELVDALHAFADAAGEPSARVSELGW